MPDHRRLRCQRCEKHRDEVGSISWTGLCRECALRAFTLNRDGLVNHTGAAMRRWRLGMIRSAGGYTLDDVQAFLESEGHA